MVNDLGSTAPTYDVRRYDGRNRQAEYNTDMETRSPWHKKLARHFTPFGEADLQAFKEVLPFFIMVTLVIGWVYYQVRRTAPALLDTGSMAVFTVLLVIHLLLYWLTIFFSVTPRRTLAYIIIQGFLVLVIVMVSRSEIVVMSLYAALIGNAVGILGKRKASLAAFGFYLALAVISLMVVTVSPQLKEILVILLPVTGFTVFFAYVLNRQLEARSQMEALLAELEEAHEQLTEYTIRVEDLTLAGERQRMARELHDTLAQGLAGLILQLEAAVIHIEGDNSEKARQIVEQAMLRARTTLVDARKAIDDLRSDLSEPQALQHSITREVERFRNATGIACELEMTLPDPIDPKLSEHILRTVTEGLWNIARHAQAGEAAVKLRADSGGIEILIEDDGVGFDPEDKVARSGHYGLLGIRERARLAGGQFSVTSQPGAGTKLRVRLPAEPAEEAA